MSVAARWMALGACLYDARYRTTLTQHAVARHLGISQAAYSQIERGLIRPRPIHVFRLAVLLGMGLIHLCTLAGYAPEAVVQVIAPRTQSTRTRPNLDENVHV
jgi:transcriptional regulator with XRE-family HTH domain